MAFLNLSKLKDSIESTFTTAKKLFEGDNASSIDYPASVKDNTDLSTIDPTNFSQTQDYTFSVIDQNGTQVADFIEFPLPISPQNISFQEPIPTKIKATQGGTTVFRNGIKYRNITIKGTTGIFPSRGVEGISRGGQARNSSTTAGAQGIKNASGFESFKRLQNWFRAFYLYVDANPDALQYRLVFNNYREGEFWVVELLNFVQDQDAANPLHMFYNLSFKIIGSKSAPGKPALEGLDGALAQADDWYGAAIDKVDNVRAVFMGSQDILRQVDANFEAAIIEPLRRASLAVKAASNTASTLADLGPNTMKKFATASSLLATMLGLKDFQAAQAVSSSPVEQTSVKIPVNLDNAVANQGADLLLNLPPDVQFNLDLSTMPAGMITEHNEDRDSARRLPRKFYEDAAEAMVRIRDNAADKFGVGSTDYDQLEDRVSTTTTSAFKTPTDKEFEILAAFETAQSAFNDILTSKTFFKETYAAQIARINDAFNGELGLEAKAAVRDYIVPTNITLEEIAALELGDVARWVEIKELNNLSEPFIVQNKTEVTEGVVAPGSKILLPQSGSDFGEIPIFRDSPLLDGLTQLEKSMGIDLKMTDTGDIELSNTGDFVIVKGLDNATQAIIMKLRLSKGEVLEHPDIGVGLKIGSKSQDVGDVRTAIIETLTSDPRFEGISELTVRKEGGTLYITFSLKIKNVDTPLPLELRV